MTAENDYRKTLQELEKHFARLEERLKLKFEASERALEMQAREYERRLADLNHNADKLAALHAEASSKLERIQGTFMPRELYESQQEALKRAIADNSRLIYIGLGIVIALEILLRVILN